MQDDEQTAVADHRAHRHKFSYIGTAEFDKLDEDKKFIERIAEQQQYMKMHDALPPEPLGRRVSGRRQHRRIAESE